MLESPSTPQWARRRRENSSSSAGHRWGCFQHLRASSEPTTNWISEIRSPTIISSTLEIALSSKMSWRQPTDGEWILYSTHWLKRSFWPLCVVSPGEDVSSKSENSISQTTTHSVSSSNLSERDEVPNTSWNCRRKARSRVWRTP